MAQLGTPLTATATAALVEAFVSLQGEGPYVGAPTLFVRTAKCPLRCSYCDTVESYVARERFAARGAAGNELAVFDNPCGARELFGAYAQEIERSRPEFVALTGGEPTLWPDFAREVFELAHAHGLRTLLETAADDAQRVEQCLAGCDVFSMDYKLPSTIDGRELQSQHLASLRAARRHGCELIVKVVLTPRISGIEFEAMLRALEPEREGVALVLQPVTPCLHEAEAPRLATTLAFAEHARARGFDVRVIPQVHKQLGID